MALHPDKAKQIGRFDLINKEEVFNTPHKYFVGDETVLNNPIYDKAFKKILQLHQPKNKTAFLSLCTGKRPYYKSAKWKKYKLLFNGVDFIVTSNGGLIPEKFWHEYIYLIYDAPGRETGSEELAKNKQKKHNFPQLYGGKHYEGVEPKMTTQEVNELYQQKMKDRLIQFFTKHHYDYVYGDYTKEQRAHKAFVEAMEYLKKNNKIKDYFLPAEDIKERCTDLGYLKPHGVGRMFPTLHSLYLKELNEIINKIGKTNQELDEW